MTRPINPRRLLHSDKTGRMSENLDMGQGEKREVE